jgi:hypothetical protein
MIYHIPIETPIDAHLNLEYLSKEFDALGFLDLYDPSIRIDEIWFRVNQIKDTLSAFPHYDYAVIDIFCQQYCEKHKTNSIPISEIKKFQMQYDRQQTIDSYAYFLARSMEDLLHVHFGNNDYKLLPYDVGRYQLAAAVIRGEKSIHVLVSGNPAIIDLYRRKEE